MRHIRVPVTTGHEEAGWFGYIYMWQCQPNGAVGTRLEMNDPRDPNRSWFQKDWNETIGVDALAAGENPMSLEEDSHMIMHDFYPHLRRSGEIEVKTGRWWVGKYNGVRYSKV